MPAARKHTLVAFVTVALLAALAVSGSAASVLNPKKDREDPSVPANVRVTAATQTSVSLAWEPSTDNVGVAFYYVYFDAVRAQVSETTYTAANLSCGRSGKAYHYFMETARLDLDDTHGNTRYGIHTASMAGTWLGIACGFGGMRVSHGRMRFAPTLPPQWTHYQFKVHFKDALVQLRVEREQVVYTLLKGEAAAFDHGSSAVSLSRQAPQAVLPMDNREAA